MGLARGAASASATGRPRRLRGPKRPQRRHSSRKAKPETSALETGNGSNIAGISAFYSQNEHEAWPRSIPGEIGRGALSPPARGSPDIARHRQMDDEPAMLGACPSFGRPWADPSQSTPGLRRVPCHPCSELVPCSSLDLLPGPEPVCGRTFVPVRPRPAPGLFSGQNRGRLPAWSLAWSLA